MRLLQLFFIFSLLSYLSTPAARAAGDRDLIIQETLNCVDQHLQQNPGISWNDVCVMPESPSQQHMDIVNGQMDRMQGKSAPDIQTPSLDPPKKRVWTFDLTPEVSYIRYNEHSFMKESGTMYGFNGIYTYHPPEGDPLNTSISDVYRFEGRFSYGKVNYDGGIQNSDGSVTPESFKGISDYMVEIRGLLGKDFSFRNQSILFTPYMGAGYRSLFDAFYANKPYGYNRHIQYIYLPTGSDLTLQLGDGWSLGVNAEYDFFIRGFVQSYLEEIGLGNVQNTQLSGYGFRGSVKLIKKCDGYNLFLEPFFRYWNMHSSRVDASDPFGVDGVLYYFPDAFYEPANTSLEVGGKLGIEF